MTIIFAVLLLLAIGTIIFLLFNRKRNENSQAINSSPEHLEKIQTDLIQKLQLVIQAEVPKATGEAIKNANDSSTALFEQQKQTLDGQIKNLLTPTKNDLKNLQKEIEKLEKSYQNHSGNTKSLENEIERMRQSTSKFGELMSDSKSRGDWGEVQLENLVESVGMMKHIDYKTQETLESGKRPDMKVILPNNGCIIIDSKFPADSYFKFLDESDETLKNGFLDDHVKAIEKHVNSLQEKHYESNVNATNDDTVSPEFVVMFIPIESMFLDAVAHNRELMANSASKRIILASPLNLYGFLLAVAKGWESIELEQNLEGIKRTAQTMYNKVLPLIGHIDDLGTNLAKVSKNYNSVIGSLEGPVLKNLKDFEQLGLKSDKKNRTNFVSADIPPLRSLKPETLELEKKEQIED